MKTALWWVRRDQRLADNQALRAALDQAESVVPVFVMDPVLLSAPDAGAKRVAFMFGCLRQLDSDLRGRGSRLIVRRGDPVEQLAMLAHETGADSIFAEEDYWPYGVQRDVKVAKALRLNLVGGLTVHPPSAVKKSDGSPYTVYTPFRKAWKALPLPEKESVLPAPDRLPPVPGLPSVPIPAEPAQPSATPFPPDEAKAMQRLQRFVKVEPTVVYSYAEGRHRLDLEGTSQLSPYLRFGVISARQAVVSALSAIEAAPDAQARKGAETWLNELIWREFYMSILHHHPTVLKESFRGNLRNIEWQNNEAAFAAWCEGRTGYPVVDAAMRQLAETGWIHNRARMIVASFLVKDLLVDWRWGERFFMQHLVDGDPAANNGGWQWTAGTGTDAAPYFRIFNPILQSKKHDPDGHYVRRWVPELADVPDRYVHTPWEMPADVQTGAGCIIDKDYPTPIVDHARAREHVLSVYAHARETS